MSDVRVVVVDDQQLIREGIAALLGIQAGITVVGTAGDGQAAVDLAVEQDPDVVLMDVRMPVLDGIAALGLLRRRNPRTRVVMLTTFDDEEYVVRALRAGASGYLLKDRPAAELAAAVRLAHSGVVQFDPAAAARLATALDHDRPPGHDRPPDHEHPPGREDPPGPERQPGPEHPPSPQHPPSHERPPGLEGLTDREVDVLRLVATGATNREIARRLHLSEGTVKNHVSRILGRLGLRDRTQAAVHARDRGLR
ncbi:response regulator transcription factor [Actinosynnema sp. NPDC050801]|uniref:response regulator transcription factor n=1 Tax=unclassified Actinosynnema TaxID=2637065 RepID=UPI0033FA96AB